MKRKRKRKKEEEKKREEKKEKRPQKGTSLRRLQKCFFAQNVARNRNEIEALPKNQVFSTREKDTHKKNIEKQ